VVVLVEKLARLKRELAETESLLRSSRVNESTRYVLEQLRADLLGQIAALEEPEPADRPSTAADEPAPD